ncbi:MAG: N-acetylneuraminate synthase [Methanomicrobia archaeon]|nr:N-acetylneuraminate synthase [Methanomicrobia archaeon]
MNIFKIIENRTFIIAEAGVNHNGSLQLAKKLVDAAKDAGADAVKFQTFRADNLVTQSAKKAEYQEKNASEGESQYEMLKKLELTKDEFSTLFDYTKNKGMIFLSSPFDKASVDLLDSLGVNAFKIASGEITNIPLLCYVATKGKPIILSTGMSMLDEVEAAVNILRNVGAHEIVLLHCVSNYPALIAETNLRAITTLKQAFKVPVGFSDHTIGITATVAAIALGACVIEKHFTLDRSLPGPDHQASLEPEEMMELVKTIRAVEQALGNGIKKPTPSEEVMKKVARRSIVAGEDISAGTIITASMLDLKRPGTGLEPQQLNNVIGRKANKAIKRNELITFEIIS